VSDITTLPWADQTFDAALSTSTIHHNLRAGIVHSLDEIRRVLKPGGLLLVDFPSTDRNDYHRLREQVAAGETLEVEPNTFVDERPDSEDSDGFLPHHYCDEADARDLMQGFEILRLWIEQHVSHGTNRAGKWVAFARKPVSDG
jgi:SAM-dependent methyltransferase